MRALLCGVPEIFLLNYFGFMDHVHTESTVQGNKWELRINKWDHDIATTQVCKFVFNRWLNVLLVSLLVTVNII